MAIDGERMSGCGVHEGSEVRIQGFVINYRCLPWATLLSILGLSWGLLQPCLGTLLAGVGTWVLIVQSVPHR